MDKKTLERGYRIRSKVLGRDYAARSLKSRSFSAPLHELVIQYGWGDVWSGKHLDLKTRSLLMIVMLTALNRPEQLAVHIGGALNNGATKGEILEALQHAAVVCGAPAALDAGRVADAFFAKLEKSKAK